MVRNPPPHQPPPKKKNCDRNMQNLQIYFTSLFLMCMAQNVHNCMRMLIYNTPFIHVYNLYPNELTFFMSSITFSVCSTHLVAKLGMSKGRGKQWQTTPKNLPRNAACQSHTGRLTGLWFLPKQA
jgi:hypothetical protein